MLYFSNVVPIYVQFIYWIICFELLNKYTSPIYVSWVEGGKLGQFEIEIEIEIKLGHCYV